MTSTIKNPRGYLKILKTAVKNSEPRPKKDAARNINLNATGLFTMMKMFFF